VHCPLERSHTRTDLSDEPVASENPSGLNNTLLTQPERPSKVALHCPLAKSHARAVVSIEPVASERPFGLNARLLTQPEWPLNMFTSAGQLFMLTRPSTKAVHSTPGFPSAKDDSCSLLHASLCFDEEEGASRSVT
jgi:hypothetical protein